MEHVILLAVAVAVAGLVLLALLLLRATVLEYERGLKYKRGKFKKVLGPGVYWYMPLFSRILKVDIRPRFSSIAGQEVLSADGVTLKVSLAANYEVAEPAAAINGVQDYEQALYTELQISLRGIIGAADIDTVLDSRSALSEQLMAAAVPKAEALGLRLLSVEIKDIMFPGKLKEVFAQVVSARKEGLAALEKARGESAALRSLANAAKMLESNPNLMQLRLLQAFAEGSGNTLTLGLPGPESAAAPAPKAKPKPKPKAKAKAKTKPRGKAKP